MMSDRTHRSFVCKCIVCTLLAAQAPHSIHPASAEPCEGALLQPCHLVPFDHPHTHEKDQRRPALYSFTTVVSASVTAMPALDLRLFKMPK